MLYPPPFFFEIPYTIHSITYLFIYLNNYFGARPPSPPQQGAPKLMMMMRGVAPVKPPTTDPFTDWQKKVRLFHTPNKAFPLLNNDCKRNNNIEKERERITFTERNH